MRQSAPTPRALHHSYRVPVRRNAATSPIDVGAATDVVYLVLAGIGIRKIADLDQVNIGPLPRSLAGRSDVNLYVTVDGNRSNTVTCNNQ